jgi:chemotaxis protein histidine kinase CheA
MEAKAAKEAEKAAKETAKQEAKKAKEETKQAAKQAKQDAKDAKAKAKLEAKEKMAADREEAQEEAWREALEEQARKEAQEEQAKQEAKQKKEAEKALKQQQQQQQRGKVTSIKRGGLTSSQWQKRPAVKYRRYNGKGTHFNLGLTLEEIEGVLEGMLPWGSYARDESRFLDGNGECWNNGEINGYDLGEVVRDFLRANGFERLSIAEVLWSEGREGAAEATVFFSHIQKLPVETALQTLREASKVYRKQMGVAPKFFIDYLCIRQAQKGDFDLQVVREAIHTTPLLLVELDDAQGDIGNAAPDYFNRSFCIFEVFAAAESSEQDGEQKVLVFGPAVKNPKTAPWLARKVSTYGYNIVNSRDGQCRWPAEKEKIDAFIESTVGFEELDKVVGSAVANACIYGLQTAAAADPSQINVAAQVGVQAADLTDVQLQHFCAHHSNHDEVRTIDLHNCGQIVNVECLRVFSELRQLDIEGCDRIDIASFIVLQTACTNLKSCTLSKCGRVFDRKLDVGEFLRKHGRFEEALAYRLEELQFVKQAGSCSREREGGRE